MLELLKRARVWWTTTTVACLTKLQRVTTGIFSTLRVEVSHEGNSRQRQQQSTRTRHSTIPRRVGVMWKTRQFQPEPFRIALEVARFTEAIQTPEDLVAGLTRACAEVMVRIPHLETRWDYRLRRESCLVNLYPHPSTLSKVRFHFQPNCAGNAKQRDTCGAVRTVHRSNHRTVGQTGSA
uniref:Secreted protein n=1 Tax=Anopheles culicifacies TaxID=139723 RepID=A0A182MJL3_9DIPT